MVGPGLLLGGGPLGGEPLVVVGPGGCLGNRTLVGEPRGVVGPGGFLGGHTLGGFLLAAGHLLGSSSLRGGSLGERLLLLAGTAARLGALGPGGSLLGGQRLQLTVQDLGFFQPLGIRGCPALLALASLGLDALALLLLGALLRLAGFPSLQLGALLRLDALALLLLGPLALLLLGPLALLLLGPLALLLLGALLRLAGLGLGPLALLLGGPGQRLGAVPLLLLGALLGLAGLLGCGLGALLGLVGGGALQRLGLGPLALGALCLLGALLRLLGGLCLHSLAGLELRERDDRQHQLDAAVVGGLDLGHLDRLPLDGHQPGIDQAHDDLAGLEQREPALGGQLGHAAGAVDLAEQGPLVRTEGDLVGRRGRGQRWHGLRAAGRVEDGLPGRGAVPEVVEQLGHRRRRGDVLAGLLVLAELPGGHRPAQQVGQGVLEVLDDELLDHRELHVAQVHQQLAQPPALQLGALDLQRLGESLRGERAAGHQPDAEHHPSAGHGDGVDLAVPEVDLGLVALLVANEQAAGSAGVRQFVQHGLDGVGEEGTLRHELPPSPRSGHTRDGSTRVRRACRRSRFLSSHRQDRPEC